ncbi:sterol desaturase family protein [Synechococcus elongatus IITB4]|uniref:sterol desaturase family protein n=1 Tax=Synechococcus elongatus TaxID=32046 RepID=UPI0030CD05CE
MDLLHHSFLVTGLTLFGIILSRYFLVAGGLYWLFYHRLAKQLTRLRIQRWPSWQQSIQSDIQLSMLSAFIFAIVATLMVASPVFEWTLLYSDVSQYGIPYLIFSFFLMLILQDTGFYFCHRLFHHPRFFRRFHQGHHRSQSPTPWTSFAFDLPEAIVQALLIVAILLILPVHVGTLLAVLVTMTIWSVFNHLGFALFPESKVCHWLGQWLIGPQHHVVHHQRYRLHYGLYFTLWDRLLGTQEKLNFSSNHQIVQDSVSDALELSTEPVQEVLSVH